MGPTKNPLDNPAIKCVANVSNFHVSLSSTLGHNPLSKHLKGVTLVLKCSHRGLVHRMLEVGHLFGKEGSDKK